jgi:hypothetical protein
MIKNEEGKNHLREKTVVTDLLTIDPPQSYRRRVSDFSARDTRIGTRRPLIAGSDGYRADPIISMWREAPLLVDTIEHFYVYSLYLHGVDRCRMS